MVASGFVVVGDVFCYFVGGGGGAGMWYGLYERCVVVHGAELYLVYIDRCAVGIVAEGACEW